MIQRLVQVGPASVLLASLLGRCAGAGDLLLPAKALAAGCGRNVISDRLSTVDREYNSLVELCFLHWYTPSLLGADKGASKPSRSMGSNCIQSTEVNRWPQTTGSKYARQRTHRSLPCRRRSSRNTEEGRIWVSRRHVHTQTTIMKIDTHNLLKMRLAEEGIVNLDGGCAGVRHIDGGPEAVEGDLGTGGRLETTSSSRRRWSVRERETQPAQGLYRRPRRFPILGMREVSCRSTLN